MKKIIERRKNVLAETKENEEIYCLSGERSIQSARNKLKMVKEKEKEDIYRSGKEERRENQHFTLSTIKSFLK